MKLADAIGHINKEIVLREPNQTRVDDYAERMKAGAVFPDIVLGYWPKSDKYGESGIVDGLHRLAAAHAAGLKEIGVKEIKFDTLQEMMGYMYTVNMSHGLTPTEGQRNARIKLLKQIDATLSIDSLAGQFKLDRSSIARILKNEQGEGKPGRKTGTKKSGGHKDLEPMKPGAFFKTLGRLEYTLERKRAVAEIIGHMSPLDDDGKTVKIDKEKLASLQKVCAYLNEMYKELKG